MSISFHPLRVASRHTDADALVVGFDVPEALRFPELRLPPALSDPYREAKRLHDDLHAQLRTLDSVPRLTASLQDIVADLLSTAEGQQLYLTPLKVSAGATCSALQQRLAAQGHVLLGENGAGKSTLMSILYGYYRADSGALLLDAEVQHQHAECVHDAL